MPAALILVPAPLPVTSTSFQEMPSVLSDNTDNIQHNYELIYELKDQVEELKQEITALKLIQIISLKKEKQEANKLN